MIFESTSCRFHPLYIYFAPTSPIEFEGFLVTLRFSEGAEILGEDVVLENTFFLRNMHAWVALLQNARITCLLYRV